ncbi:MAG: ABC transporter permease [Acutalibacteraceae bacterium]
MSDELYGDRVVLDAQTAFNLFGSSDVAGMEVTINGETFPIAGVVKSEDDFATAAALDAGAEASSDPTGVQSASKAMIYMSYAALERHGGAAHRLLARSSCPTPVSGFAKKLMTEKFPLCRRKAGSCAEYRPVSLSGLIR